MRPTGLHPLLTFQSGFPGNSSVSGICILSHYRLYRRHPAPRQHRCMPGSASRLRGVYIIPPEHPVSESLWHKNCNYIHPVTGAGCAEPRQPEFHIPDNGTIIGVRMHTRHNGSKQVRNKREHFLKLMVKPVEYIPVIRNGSAVLGWEKKR